MRVEVFEQVGEADAQSGRDALDGVERNVSMPVLELDDIGFAPPDHQREFAGGEPGLFAQLADAAAKFYFDTFAHVGEYTVVFRIRGIRKLSVPEKVAQLFI